MADECSIQGTHPNKDAETPDQKSGKVEESAAESLSVDFETSFEALQGQKSSFTSVPLPQFEFDVKYALQGRFAFNVADMPAPSEPGAHISADTKDVAPTGFPQWKASTKGDVEGDVDTGEFSRTHVCSHSMLKASSSR